MQPADRVIASTCGDVKPHAMRVQIRIGEYAPVAVLGFSTLPVPERRRRQRHLLYERPFEPAARPARLAFQHGERSPNGLLLGCFDQAFCIVRSKAPNEANRTRRAQRDVEGGRTLFVAANLFEQRRAIYIERMIQAIERGAVDGGAVDETKIPGRRVPDAGRLATTSVILRLSLTRVVRTRRRRIPGRNHERKAPLWRPSNYTRCGLQISGTKIEAGLVRSSIDGDARRSRARSGARDRRYRRRWP
ncbi:hypothetical protein ACVIQT_002232 [Bradyrhizobium diazoefficiens]